MPDYDANSIKTNLERLIYKFQADTGVFLQGGNDLYGLLDGIKSYMNLPNPEVKAKAQGIQSQIYFQLDEFKRIQILGSEKIAQALTLKSTMETDPVWKSMIDNQWKILGFATLANAVKKATDAVSLTNELLKVKTQMDNHINSIQAIRDDFKKLNNMAQGKGFAVNLSSAASSALSSTMTNILKPASMIVAAGLAIYLFGPALLGKTLRAVRK